MQLPVHSGAATAASAPVDSGGHDSGSSPPGTLRASPSGGKAPAASTSPSSPGSPSKSGGTPGGATREKPVKVLPCPRCESMNTKFCYYNNYSVTQPRHFCRQCQRYWTAGGTLRNVPVGGGSRKKSRHPRGGEPYLQRSGGNNNLPGAGNPNNTVGPFGVPTQSVLQNVGHFQQMLSQETGFTHLNFAQLPGFAGYHPYAMDSVDLPPSMQHAMYGTAPGMQQPIPPYYHLQPHPDTTTPAPPFPTDTNTPGVKSEFWQHPSTMVAAAAAPLAQPNNNNPGTKRFESSMLLNLGLNTRPPSSAPQPHPQSQMQSQQQQAHPQAAGAATGAKNGSPPHGSSTIEEEGSTPTNGYSNSGYEEGDAVSSMWHSLHDMDNIFQ